MRISVDAMGGDFAPEDIIKGAIMGARENNVGLIFAGPQDKIKAEMAKYDTSGLDIEIVHTNEYLIEGEAPAYALRTKKNASITVATKLVKEGKAAAVISMGPTGGVITSALMILGTVEGISRPVVGGTFCGFAPQCVTMDMGGNIDAKPDQLLDFAIVGTVFARKILNVPNPTVALLNVGWEEGKGNAVAKEAYPLLKKSGLNFIGNIEGNDIPSGKANVIICDGFVGNVVTKFCEGLGRSIADWISKELKTEMAEDKVKKLTQDLLSLTVKADSMGGGPLWAVNGLVFKGHGRSRALEMAATVGSAKLYAEMDIVNALKTELATVKGRLKAENAGS
jgi:glycerol-3-phosphate acyltransferase PlsX